MEPPACDPGDSCIAQRAESALFMPEIAKSADTPKRFQHVSPFPFFEVGFIGWIVRVSFAVAVRFADSPGVSTVLLLPRVGCEFCGSPREVAFLQT
jgi:hypothetical protein